MYAFECLLVLLQIIKASHFLEALNIRTFKNQPWKQMQIMQQKRLFPEPPTIF